MGFAETESPPMGDSGTQAAVRSSRISPPHSNGRAAERTPALLSQRFPLTLTHTPVLRPTPPARTKCVHKPVHLFETWLGNKRNSECATNHFLNSC